MFLKQETKRQKQLKGETKDKTTQHKKLCGSRKASVPEGKMLIES